MEQCPICLLDLEYDIKEVSCCKNKFHEICYNTWLLTNPTNPTCPMCRANIIINDKSVKIMAKRITFSFILLCMLCYLGYKAYHSNL